MRNKSDIVNELTSIKNKHDELANFVGSKEFLALSENSQRVFTVLKYASLDYECALRDAAVSLAIEDGEAINSKL